MCKSASGQSLGRAHTRAMESRIHWWNNHNLCFNASLPRQILAPGAFSFSLWRCDPTSASGSFVVFISICSPHPSFRHRLRRRHKLRLPLEAFRSFDFSSEARRSGSMRAGFWIFAATCLAMKQTRAAVIQVSLAMDFQGF
jgi:hypothetical protein